MEFNNSQEYAKLPDEFNRGYREAPQPAEDRKKSLSKLLIIFASVICIIFPLTVTAESGHHSEPPIIDPIPVPFPDPPIDDPTHEDYEIVGKWENGSEFYEFLEDGNGYWTDGKLFILLKWEEHEGDYHVTGQGMSYYDTDMALTLWQLDFYTMYSSAEGLMLNTLNDSSHSASAFFHESARSFNLENITPLFGKTLAETLDGFWEHMDHFRGREDTIYNCLSYLEFDGDTVRMDFASLIDTTYSHYVVSWHVDDNYYNSMLKAGEDVTMKITIRTDSSHTYSYESNGITVYRFIDEEGMGLLADGLSNRTLLRKLAITE